MNLFISISARKEKAKYKLFKLYARKYFYAFTETINGLFIPNFDSHTDLDIITKCKEEELPIIETKTTPTSQTLDFVFFELLSFKGTEVLKKHKEFLLKYIIYPTVIIFKSTKVEGFEYHFPLTPSGVEHLTFSFTLSFKSFNLSEEKKIGLKTYIENQINKRLFEKKIIK